MVPRVVLRVLAYALACACSLVVVYFAWHSARAALFPFPLDYGEGPLLLFFVRDLAFTSGVLVLVGAVFAISPTLRKREPASLVLSLYFVGAAASALTVGKVGSHVNYFLEILAALSIFGGVAYARCTSPGAPSGRVACVTALLLVQMAWLAGIAILRPENMVAKMRARGSSSSSHACCARNPGLCSRTRRWGSW